jgi:hypothetical protein
MASSAGLGWFIVAGLGITFSLLTSLLVWLDSRFGGASHTSLDCFNVHGLNNSSDLAVVIAAAALWGRELLHVPHQCLVSGIEQHSRLSITCQSLQLSRGCARRTTMLAAGL